MFLCFCNSNLSTNKVCERGSHLQRNPPTLEAPTRGNAKVSHYRITHSRLIIEATLTKQQRQAFYGGLHDSGLCYIVVYIYIYIHNDRSVLVCYSIVY